MIRTAFELAADAWRVAPHTFAARASLGRWRCQPWLRYVGREIARAISRGGGRILIHAPVRHGKSELISHWLPVWYLSNFPQKRIILTSYGDALASGTFGAAARNEFESNPLVGVTLRQDTTAKNNWVTSEGGGMVSAGVSGPISGRGFDCFPAGTKIETEQGILDIAALARLQYPPRVWSYNHEKRRCELKRVVAIAEKRADEFSSLETRNGRKVRCTADHRVFDCRRGYRPAQSLDCGDWVLGFAAEKIQAVRALRSNKGRQRNSLPKMLFRIEAQNGSDNVRVLQESVRARSWRCSESDAQREDGRLLLVGVQPKTPLHQESSALQMRRGDVQQNQQSMPRVLCREDDARSPYQVVRVLLRDIPCGNQDSQMLLQEVRQRYAFSEDDGRRKFKLQHRRAISSEILYPQADSSGARRIKMRGVLATEENSSESLCFWQDEPLRSSYRPQSDKQRLRQSSNTMQPLPYNSPQVQRDSISVVETVRGLSEPVFDLQVEGNQNFFANGVLVHNCGIIDDPCKDGQEAHSFQYNETLWQWFTTTFSTRAEPGATMIVAFARWTDWDFSARLQKEQPGRWTVLNFAALAEEGDILGRAVGDPLFPERYDRATLEQIKTDVGRSTWQSLYQQKPELGSDRLYARFSIANQSAEITDRKDLPLCLACDFNISPGNHAEIFQYDQQADMFNVLHELHGERWDVRAICEALKAWMRVRGGTTASFPWKELKIFGDASGNSQWAGSGESCYDLICQSLRGYPIKICVDRANPPVIDRLNTVNEALRDVNDKVHVKIHPSCEKLLADLREMKPDQYGLEDKRSAKLSHASSAIGYAIAYLRPLWRVGAGSNFSGGKFWLGPAKS